MINNTIIVNIIKKIVYIFKTIFILCGIANNIMTYTINNYKNNTQLNYLKG